MARKAVMSKKKKNNLQFKIIGAEVGGVKSLWSSELLESESKLRNIPITSMFSLEATFLFSLLKIF